MYRNYEEVISEYDKLMINHRDPIRVSDLNNIKDNNHDLFNIIDNALKYGFVIGYKNAKNRKRTGSLKKGATK